MTGLTRVTETNVFKNITRNASQIKDELSRIGGLGLDQTERLLMDISKHIKSDNPEVVAKILDGLKAGKRLGEIDAVRLLCNVNSAAIKDVPEGIAVMAEGWEKPIVFAKDNFVAWADKPQVLSTNELWTSTYGYQPSLIMGAVGNSNIKPEQVLGGCSMSKKELSKKYEDAIVDFYAPIVTYLKENGAKVEDIGFAFAHSDCGVDKAARQVVENGGLKGLATTPTEYTQYLRGREMPPTAEMPNGYILADFPFPSVLTRNTAQIDDYATVYSKMVGKDNPIGIFGGGEHAYARDVNKAFFEKEGSIPVPVDVMKDKFGIVIPATSESGAVLNASRDMLERVSGNPYEQYRYTFRNYLPASKTKQDLAQYDPQASIATIAYTQLKKAGKID